MIRIKRGKRLFYLKYYLFIYKTCYHYRKPSSSLQNQIRDQKFNYQMIC